MKGEAAVVLAEGLDEALLEVSPHCGDAVRLQGLGLELGGGCGAWDNGAGWDRGGCGGSRAPSRPVTACPC